MKENSNLEKKIKTPLDLITFVILIFIFTLSMVQLIVVIEGDIMHEQKILNCFWASSMMAIAFLCPMRAAAFFIHVSKTIQQNTTSSSYIRQGDDEEILMDAK